MYVNRIALCLLCIGFSCAFLVYFVTPCEPFWKEMLQTLSGEGSILTLWCICDLGIGFALCGEGAENIIMLPEVKLVNFETSWCLVLCYWKSEQIKKLGLLLNVFKLSLIELENVRSTIY